jgi:ATP-binding cassette subfamily B protein
VLGDPRERPDGGLAEEPRTIDLGLLARLAPFVRPHRRLLLLAIVLVPVEALLGLLQPYLVKRAIDDAILPRALSLLAPISIALLAVIVLERLALYAQGVLLERTAQHAMHDLRCAAHRHLLSLSASFFDRSPVGVLMTRVTSDVESLGEAVSGGLVTVAGDLITVVGIVVAMVVLSPRLALVSFLTIPPLLVVVVSFRRLLRRTQQEIRRRVAELNGTLQEHLSGMKVVQIFGREEQAMARFDVANRGHRDAYRSSIRYDASLFSLVEMLGSLTVALLLWYGGAVLGVVSTGPAAAGGGITFGLLVAFIQYAQRLFIPIRDLSAKLTVLQQASVAADRVFALLATHAPDGFPAKQTVSPACSVAGEGPAVELDRVGFAYRPGQVVLDGISIAIQHGETVALVGASGAGKTSIARLLQAMYRPSEGMIRIAGRSLQEIPLEELRRRVVVVSQDVTLFTGTVASNISLGDPRLSDEAVRAAAEAVGVTRRLALDATVQERGANLSAGERQLCAFARALVRAPEVLILDEATAAVDPETERLVQAGIAELLRGRTCIVIAHRLTTIERAHRILVLQRGRIVEEGSHAELVTRAGVYARLYELQRLSASTLATAAPGSGTAP